MTDARPVADLLAERPDLEPAVRAALETDRRADGPWTFADLDADSGAFGELVSRGVVEKRGGGYRLADPAATRRALDGEGTTDATGGTPRPSRPSFDSLASLSSLSLRTDRRSLLALAGALALVAIFRLVSLPAVFRDRVVLSGNDPYYYRYWVERALAQAGGALDFAVLSNFPEALTKGEPLLVATLWVASTLLGGTREAAGVVLAIYPVVSALLAALFVYLLARRVSGDRRVALAAVALLAVVPAHALRTGLGFADHHAFDYVFLSLTAYALVVALGERSRPLDSDGLASSATSALAALGIGVGVAGQALAWDNGPLLLLPFGLAVAAIALVAVHEGRSLLPAGLPVVAGTGLAALLAHLAHAGFGWHTSAVAYAPFLLFVGCVAVLAVGEASVRLGVPALAAGVVLLVGGVGGVLAVQSALPDLWAGLLRGVDTLFRTDGIVEVQSLFDGRGMGWLLLFGFALVLALPYTAWGLYRGWRGRFDWLALGVYTLAFLVLAGVQLRFAGELAHFVAVFAGLGFVHLAGWVEVTDRPAPFDEGTRADGGRGGSRTLSLPDRRQAGALLALFLLVGGLGMVQVPVKTSQVTIPQSQYETAEAMDEYAAAQNLSYPESYVLSEWGRNRMYNYFVSGESRSYSRARTTFEPFLTGRPAKYDTRGFAERVGFVVVEDASTGVAGSMGVALARYGSRGDETPGLGHYRAIHVSPDGEYTAFRVVPGATVRGTASGETVTLSTNVSVDGESFTYTRRATVENGTYAVTLAYPGEYRIEGGGATSVRVSEAAVENGTATRA
ncbi:STT3 domain-containing protein [Halomarina litorea]|uniref:STT3 domain-containing protein n=1 Tax=Halomarina litorea TaxID=2961595 RepID=UPI0020C2E09E|nr:STT3 domain-containing protein [Halomarina sp. BCD28]